MHLSGYDLSLEDLKNFRQLGSKTPGHPEIHTKGVEVATGPLGQGVANAVGFAMAAKYAANLLNDPKNAVIDHKIYCLCGDGDLQEGISYEACAVAGNLHLDNLVLIYDSNNITIEGDTSIAWSEDVKARFEAQGWDVARIDGHDYDQIEFALEQAAEKERPYLIIANTRIAKGAGELEGSHHSHGAPLGEEIIKAAKIAAGFDPERKFAIDEDVLIRFRAALEKGDLAEAQWNKKVENLSGESKKKSCLFYKTDSFEHSGVPTGIRTPVPTVKGLCPRPLDDGDLDETFLSAFGGGKRDRTADLLHAMQALSQLSYTPARKKREL